MRRIIRAGIAIQMKLKKFILLVIIVLVVLSAVALFAPVIGAYSVNGSLVKGATAQGGRFQYTMDSVGPICFLHQNGVSREISNLGMTTSYVNISMESGEAVFSISIYGQPPGSSSVNLAKSFKLYASSSSEIYQSFFPPDFSGAGQFYHAFNVIGEDTGITTDHGIINVGKASLYSVSQKTVLLSVPCQPTGYYGQLSQQMASNTVYYLNTPSNAFLSYLLFSGNSTVVSLLLGSSSVTNVSLFYLQLVTENSALSSLNLQHYIIQYAIIAVIIWVVGVIYLVSVYRVVSRKGKR
ncbi:MAG: hypothetical protein M1533_05110 [Candidatus Thermoplasmatota archaeon]|nr:hypothetical protein [Candidatus Thermoplasmatota archaeon]